MNKESFELSAHEVELLIMSLQCALDITMDDYPHKDDLKAIQVLFQEKLAQ